MAKSKASFEQLRLLIDSSVWFDLAQDPKQERLLAAIEHLISQKKVALIVPRIALDELQRNQERIAGESSKSLASHFRIVKDSIDRLEPDSHKKTPLLQNLEEIQRKIPTTGGWSAIAIGRIGRLLNQAPTIEHSDSILRKASLRALERRAPFHLGKNSMADAVLIESFAECVRTEGNSAIAFGFVTHNTNDFSQHVGHKGTPHANFGEIFASLRSRYFIKVSDALDAIDSTALVTARRDEPTIRDLIHRFITERTKPIRSSHGYTLSNLANSNLGERLASAFRASDVVRHVRNRTNMGIGPATLSHDVVYLQGVVTKAAKDWGVNISLQAMEQARASLSNQGLIGRSLGRFRRPTETEFLTLVEYLRRPPKKFRKNLVGTLEVLEFTRSSALRSNEICRLKWADLNVKEKTIRLAGRITSNTGKDRTDVLTLSDAAMAIIQNTKRRDELIFPFKSKSVGAAVRRAAKAVGIRNLCLDDFRRDAFYTWFDQGIPPHEVARRLGLLRIDPLLHRYELHMLQAKGKKKVSSGPQSRRLLVRAHPS